MNRTQRFPFPLQKLLLLASVTAAASTTLAALTHFLAYRYHPQAEDAVLVAVFFTFPLVVPLLFLWARLQLNFGRGIPSKGDLDQLTTRKHTEPSQHATRRYRAHCKRYFINSVETDLGPLAPLIPNFISNVLEHLVQSKRRGVWLHPSDNLFSKQRT
jgi:hypothetical protein